MCSASSPAEPPRYSVVVPVYRNAATLPELVDQVRDLAARMGGGVELVLVVDGSPDDSAAVIRGMLPLPGLCVQLVEHSRNFGSFAAIRTGLAAARGDYLGVISADLQEPVELLEHFFAALGDGVADVAVGVRASRSDPLTTTVPSRFYWGLYRRVVVREIPSGGVDVFGCTAQVRDTLLSMRESHTSLVAQLYWLGYRRLEIPYHRRARTDGTSGWSWRRRFAYMQDSIYAFTPLPITVLAVVGSVGTVLALAASAVVVAAWLAGAITVAGYTPIMLALLLSTSLVLTGLGIVGSYVWRTFENSKGRPLAVVARHEVHERGS